jgi:hypothetical protein
MDHKGETHDKKQKLVWKKDQGQNNSQGKRLESRRTSYNPQR